MKRLIPALVASLIMLSGCTSNASPPLNAISEISDGASSLQSIVQSESDGESVAEQSIIQNTAASSLPSPEEYVKQVIRDTIPKFTQPNMSEYEKVKAAFDYLIEIGYYQRPIALDVWRFRSSGDTIPSYVETRSLNMLLFGFGTCEDFAASLIMLLDEMEIDSRYMTGLTYTRGGGMTYHSWIQAKVDDIWYHLDVELDDGISSDDGMVNYRYFMKSNATMRGSHYWGQGLIDYAGARLQPEQIAEIREEYMGENCPQDYPTPDAKYIAVNQLHFFTYFCYIFLL